MKVITPVSLAVVLILSACSASSGDPGSVASASAPASATGQWQQPQDVLDALDQAGFGCSWSGFGDQILDRNPVTGEPVEVVVVRCDGYGVALGSGEEGWYSLLVPECELLDEADRESPVATSAIVLGSNFAILGSDEDGAFPADTPIEDFVDAFGGQTTSLADLYEQVCES